MIAQQRQVRSVSAARCTDLLSAKENPDSCNVRRCQKNCDKLLHCQTIDRGAPWALYPAIKRLPKLRPAVPAPSFAMVRSGKSRAKRSGSRPRADSLQPLCRSLVDRRASCSPNRPKAGRRNCGGRAGCLQIGRRAAPGRRLSVRRGKCPVLRIADESADMAISTRITLRVISCSNCVRRYRSR